MVDVPNGTGRQLDNFQYLVQIGKSFPHLSKNWGHVFLWKVANVGKNKANPEHAVPVLN